MDFKTFSILDWVQRDLLIMQRIKTADNCSDVMTKQTGKQLFHRHFDYIMGRIVPDYVNSNMKTTDSTINNSTYCKVLCDMNMIIFPEASLNVCSRNMGGIMPRVVRGTNTS